jgi:hypothetical protein
MGAPEKAADETLKKDKMDEDNADLDKIKDVKKDTEGKDGGGKKKKDEKEEDLVSKPLVLLEGLIVFCSAGG